MKCFLAGECSAASVSSQLCLLRRCQEIRAIGGHVRCAFPTVWAIGVQTTLGEV